MIPNAIIKAHILWYPSSIHTLRSMSKSRPDFLLWPLNTQRCSYIICHSLFMDSKIFISATSQVLRNASCNSTSSLTSRDFKPASPTHESNLPTDPSSFCKPIIRFSPSKEGDDNAPDYYPCSYPEVSIASDAKSPTTDDADTYTISTFSYYGSASSPSSPSHRFDLTHSNSPSEPQGLSPPPLCPVVKRSISKRDSIMTRSPSRPSSPPLVPLDGTESSGRTTMDIPEGVLVTGQKQASADKLIWRPIKPSKALFLLFVLCLFPLDSLHL